MNESTQMKTIDVLLVDDEKDVGELAMDQLECSLASVRVTYFSDPKAALEHVLSEEKRYDLIITDYNMPGMSGAELLLKIHGSGKYKDIFQQSIVVTAKMGGDSDSIFSYNAKQEDPSLRAANIIAKPFMRMPDPDPGEGHQRKESLSNTLVYRVHKMLTERGYQVLAR